MVRRGQSLEKGEEGHVDAMDERSTTLDDLVRTGHHDPPSRRQLFHAVGLHPPQNVWDVANLRVTELDLHRPNGEREIRGVAEPGHLVPVVIIHERSLGPRRVDEEDVLRKLTPTSDIGIEERRDIAIPSHFNARQDEDDLVQHTEFTAPRDDFTNRHRRQLRQLGPHGLTAVEPNELHRHDDGPNHNRDPTTIRQLEQVRPEVRRVNDVERDEQRHDLEPTPVPLQPRDGGEGQGGRHHGTGHGHTVGAGQLEAGFEGEDEDDRTEAESPVDEAGVDLPFHFRVDVLDGHGGKPVLIGRTQRRTHRRQHHGEGRDDRRSRSQRNHRSLCPSGHRGVERVVVVDHTITQEVRPLAEVVDEQQRESEHPGPAKGLGTEVSQVAPERFAARVAEHDAAEDDERLVEAVVVQEGDRVDGVEGREDAGVVDQRESTHERRREEPDDDHRAGEHADGLGALAGDHENAEDDDRADDVDVPRGEAREHHRQTFHRREDGDGRSDDRLARHEADREDEEHADPEHHLLLLHPTVQVATESVGTALVVVVGLEDPHEVLPRGADGQGPDDAARHPEDVLRGPLDAVRAVEHLVEGVEDAGAQITEHTADGEHDEGGGEGLEGLTGMNLRHVRPEGLPALPHGGPLHGVDLDGQRPALRVGVGGSGGGLGILRCLALRDFAELEIPICGIGTVAGTRHDVLLL